MNDSNEDLTTYCKAVDRSESSMEHIAGVVEEIDGGVTSLIGEVLSISRLHAKVQEECEFSRSRLEPARIALRELSAQLLRSKRELWKAQDAKKSHDSESKRLHKYCEEFRILLTHILRHAMLRLNLRAARNNRRQFSRYKLDLQAQELELQRLRLLSARRKCTSKNESEGDESFGSEAIFTVDNTNSEAPPHQLIAIRDKMKKQLTLIRSLLTTRDALLQEEKTMVGASQRCSSSALLHEEQMDCIHRADESLAAAANDCDEVKRANESLLKDLLMAQESIRHLSACVQRGLELRGIPSCPDRAMNAPTSNPESSIVQDADLLLENIHKLMERESNKVGKAND